MGEVVRLDLPRKTATVRHGPVKDAAGKLWMEGMTMEFPIRDEKSLALLRPGVRIKAKLFQQPADFDFWLGEVEVVP
jgi:Cu/Ag efflux protein CusF